MFLWGPKTRIGSEPGRRAKTAVKFKSISQSTVYYEKKKLYITQKRAVSLTYHKSTFFKARNNLRVSFFFFFFFTSFFLFFFRYFFFFKDFSMPSHLLTCKYSYQLNPTCFSLKYHAISIPKLI